MAAAGQEKEESEYSVFFRNFTTLADVQTPEVTRHDLGCQVRGTGGKQRGAGGRHIQGEFNLQERAQGSEGQGCCQMRGVCVCVYL